MDLLLKMKMPVRGTYILCLGYHALEFTSDEQTRLLGLDPYIHIFTGTEPDQDSVDPFLKYIKHTQRKHCSHQSSKIKYAYNHQTP